MILGTEWERETKPYLNMGGKDERRSDNSISLGGWAIAWAVTVLLYGAVAFFPVTLFEVAAVSGVEWSHLVVCWGILAFSFMMLSKAFSIPLPAEMASIGIAALHGIYATALGLEGLGHGYGLWKGLQTLPNDIQWSEPYSPLEQLFMKSELAYYTVDMLLLVFVYQRLHWNFIGHHFVCSVIHTTFLHFTAKRGAAMIMAYAVWAEVSNPLQQAFWSISHVQYFTGGKGGPLVMSVTKALGILYMWLFVLARGYCAIVCVYQMYAYYEGAMDEVFPRWGSALVCLVPVLVLHGSLDLVLEMWPGVMSGRRHAFGEYGTGPKPKEA